MITEDYCSFEVARLLKEKGFDEEIHTTFDKEGYTQPSITHQIAMKWLREKGIYIQIRRNVNTYLYGAIMLKDGSGVYATIPSEHETYEEAVEAALKYSLENLI